MRELTITEQFILCIVSKKGILKAKNRGLLISAMIMDLKYEGFVNISNDIVTINKELTADYEYLREIYSYVEENKEVKLVSLKSKLTPTALSTRQSSYALNFLKNRLISEGVLFELSHNKYCANGKVLDYVVNNLKSIVLSDSPDSRTMYLITLLKYSDIFKMYFSKYEVQKIKQASNVIRKNNKCLFYSEQAMYNYSCISMFVCLIAFNFIYTGFDVIQSLFFIAIISLVLLPLTYMGTNRNIWIDKEISK